MRTSTLVAAAANVVKVVEAMPGSHTMTERSRVGQGAGVALSGPVKAAYSQLDGTVTGGATCLGNYDPNLAPVSCP